MLDPGSKAGRIAATIRSRIVSGVYAPGSFLPAERVLAEDLGVARNTVRAALDSLARDGFVRHEGRRGTVVNSAFGGGADATFLLVSPAVEEHSPSLLTPEAMALIGNTLCACSGSNIQFHFQAMPPEGARELVRIVHGARLAGVLLVECSEPAVLEALHDEGIPHVVINQEQDMPGPATRVDFWQIGRHAAEFLLDLGHRRLGVLSGPSDRHLYGRMVAGFRDRLAEAGGSLRPEHVAHVKSCSEAARSAALQLLSRPDRPTAVFCTRDVRAYGAYLAARDLGLRVPEDLSLVGYDDITWPGEGRQFLTTFPEPARELGTSAIHMLISWIRTGIVPEDVIICPELVIRRSAAPCSEEGDADDGNR
ncbi:MAG: substrate-binding domain-containing protein [Armatimonadetes bacterium]|jgi:DNA-binding LacI/PurR family transcriptional regulator|nr:substrate-binding domain-containing protein [Armatimonadota bacterium]HPO72050.1 substrate-binding domain-containing protein [Armatimonadota bacterium]